MSRSKEWARILWKSARQRAEARGIAFDLEVDDIVALAEASGYTCALTGLPFDFSAIDNRRERRRPFYPSLDRIKPEKGYVLSNVRLVCVGMNYALNEWGEDVLRMLAKGFLGLLGASGASMALNKSTKLPKGVYLKRDRSRSQPFAARLCFKRKMHHLGTFATQEEAHRAYINARNRAKAGLPIQSTGGSDGNDQEARVGVASASS
jgi:hypothetical protein